MICFHFSNFEPLETASDILSKIIWQLWFAFILVTLSHWKQPANSPIAISGVVICFHFSNFEPLETAETASLPKRFSVVICFHFSNFEPLETAPKDFRKFDNMLWFAFILVTLSHWKQQPTGGITLLGVVICFHFSNFEPLETAPSSNLERHQLLWFAFILVTLSHWKQRRFQCGTHAPVVICFHFSNFEPLETAHAK